MNLSRFSFLICKTGTEMELNKESYMNLMSEWVESI